MIYLLTRLKKKRTSFDFRMKIEGNFYQIVSILINIGSESSTTRYSSIRRDPTDSRRCIEFSSNRMGRMERSCITRNDGKDGDFTNEWNEGGGEIPAVWKWELPGSGVKLKRG